MQVKKYCRMLCNTFDLLNYRLMQVKSIAECSAILLTCIKLPFNIKIFIVAVLHRFYMGFTVPEIRGM